MAHRDYPPHDTSSSEHERRVLDEREGPVGDPTGDPGRRLTSDEDLAADRDVNTDEDDLA